MVCRGICFLACNLRFPMDDGWKSSRTSELLDTSVDDIYNWHLGPHMIWIGLDCYMFFQEHSGLLTVCKSHYRIPRERLNYPYGKKGAYKADKTVWSSHARLGPPCHGLEIPFSLLGLPLDFSIHTQQMVVIQEHGYTIPAGSCPHYVFAMLLLAPANLLWL